VYNGFMVTEMTTKTKRTAIADGFAVVATIVAMRGGKAKL